jgi:hypothetical protein
MLLTGRIIWIHAVNYVVAIINLSPLSHCEEPLPRRMFIYNAQVFWEEVPPSRCSARLGWHDSRVQKIQS